MIKLTDQEQNLVDLINQLSEYANDETTTQGVISGLIDKIKQSTDENIKKEMEKAEQEAAQEEQNPTPPSTGDFSSKFNSGTLNEKLQMLQDISNMSINEPVHECTCKNERNMQMFFTRIREVKSPGKAHPTDAGLDFYVPDEKSWNDEFKKMVQDYSKNPDDKMVHFENDESNGGQVLIVEPNAHVAIPSGIKTIIPEGFGMMFVNKSGVATKKKLDHSACLVDSEYRGEVIMCFFNHSLVPITIEPGMKITQGLIVPIINLEMNEVLNCVYDDMGKDTDRGGGFGSSGTK